MSAEVLTALQPGGGPDPSSIPPAEGNSPASLAQTPKIPDVLTILPVRGFVVFPGTVAPLILPR